mgnify:CR=1 FL=1
MDKVALEKAVIEKLSKVIDPETGVDVIRMKLIQNTRIDESNKLFYEFRPSSPLCPIAVPLVLDIIHAIREIHEISGQSVTVVDYIQADELNNMLKSVLG